MSDKQVRHLCKILYVNVPLLVLRPNLAVISNVSRRPFSMYSVATSLAQMKPCWNWSWLEAIFTENNLGKVNPINLGLLLTKYPRVTREIWRPGYSMLGRIIAQIKVRWFCQLMITVNFISLFWRIFENGKKCYLYVYGFLISHTHN